MLALPFMKRLETIILGLLETVFLTNHLSCTSEKRMLRQYTFS